MTIKEKLKLMKKIDIHNARKIAEFQLKSGK